MKLERPVLFIIVSLNFCHCTEDNENQSRQSARLIKGPYFGPDKESSDTFVQEVQNLSFSDIVTRLLLNQLNSLHIPKLIPNNLSADLVEDIIYDYALGVKKEDVNLNIVQLITKYGYPIEQHAVQTEDGYILTVFRIPKNGTVVFLMHGLLESADDWVTAGPESGIAYLLASNGYDVWIGNARGNKHSRKHKILSPSKAEFWDFSWDEIGRYDLPAMIDYVLATTGKKKLAYVGHSQGTTSFFVMGSSKPEYNDKVSLMIALSAVAWMSHVKSPLPRLLAPANPFLGNVLQAVGYHEFIPSDGFTKVLQGALCGRERLAQIFCNNLSFLLCGFSPGQANVTNLPIIYGHIPSGASTKQILHYGQEIVSGRFQKFDYGSKLNMKKYGSETPPDYPVEMITAPVAIFTSDNDWFANITDVEILRQKLPHVIEVYNVLDNKFNHLDFVYAKDIKILVFSKLLELLMKF